MKPLLFVLSLILLNCASITTNKQEAKPIQCFWEIRDSISNDFQKTGCIGLFYYDNSIVLSRKDMNIFIAVEWKGLAMDTWNAKHYWKNETLYVETYCVSSMLTDMWSNGCAFDSVLIDSNKIINLATERSRASIRFDSIPEFPRMIGYNARGFRKIYKYQDK